MGGFESFCLVAFLIKLISLINETFQDPNRAFVLSSTSFSRSRLLLLGPRHFSKIQGFSGAHFFEIMVALSGIRSTPDSF